MLTFYSDSLGWAYLLFRSSQSLGISIHLVASFISSKLFKFEAKSFLGSLGSSVAPLSFLRSFSFLIYSSVFAIYNSGSFGGSTARENIYTRRYFYNAYLYYFYLKYALPSSFKSYAHLSISSSKVMYSLSS